MKNDVYLMFGPIKSMVARRKNGEPQYSDCDGEGCSDSDCGCDVVDDS